MAAQKLLAVEAAKKVEEVEVKPQAPVKGKATKGQGKAKAAKNQEEVSGDEKVKRTRKPSTFNLFMKDRLAEMKEDSELMEQLPIHKDRFKQAAAEWKEMPDDEKETLKAALMDKYADELAAPVEKPAKKPAKPAKPAKPKAPKAPKAKPVPEPIPEEEEEEEASDDEEEASDDEE
jgi:hypothetical protein